MYQRMQAMIGQCEYTLEKGINTYEMNKQEQKNYEKLRQDIGKERKITAKYPFNSLVLLTVSYELICKLFITY